MPNSALAVDEDQNILTFYYFLRRSKWSVPHGVFTPTYKIDRTRVYVLFLGFLFAFSKTFSFPLVFLCPLVRRLSIQGEKVYGASGALSTCWLEERFIEEHT